jgi:hypothetical protein
MRKFYRDYEVLRTRTRQHGENLPANQILVKLREAGRSPKWTLLRLDEYQANVRLCEVRKPLSTDDSSTQIIGF